MKRPAIRNELSGQYLLKVGLDYHIIIVVIKHQNINFRLQPVKGTWNKSEYDSFYLLELIMGNKVAVFNPHSYPEFMQ